MKQADKPTEGELEILSVLWNTGPATVRQVHREIAALRGQPVAYTTVLKLLQIMTEKGLVAREESSRAHVYRAAVEKEQTQRRLLADLRDKAFGGSAAQLIMQALSGPPATAEELQEIREMLDRFEGGKR